MRNMKIQEVEALVGITKKNIRFYEEAGLISPKRNRENGYRDYCEADVNILKQIRLLRTLDVPLSEIKAIQEGHISLENAMQRHQFTLKGRMETLSRCQEMCRTIAQEAPSLSGMDVDALLSRIDEMQAKGDVFMNPRKTDVRKKMLAPILSAAVMIVLMLFVIGLVFFGYASDPIPLGVLIFILIFPVTVCIGTALALVSRYRELKKGELDDASRY